MAAHRRIVLLANLSIAVAGFTRLLQIFPLHPTSPVGNYFFFFSGTLFIVLLMLFWDWKKNRVMKQFMMGTVFVVAVQVVSIILFYKPAWKTFAGGVIAAWGKFAL
jgi:predicted neutral ceramidase superfamily lipid hydrolase